MIVESTRISSLIMNLRKKLNKKNHARKSINFLQNRLIYLRDLIFLRESIIFSSPDDKHTLDHEFWFRSGEPKLMTFTSNTEYI